MIVKYYMDKKIITKIQKELLAKKKKLIKELDALTEKGGGKGKRPAFVDLGSASDDNAQEISMYSTSLSVSKVLESDLKDIETALQLIEKGTYGICKYCKKDIGEKRLLARPASTSCVACKSKLQHSV